MSLSVRLMLVLLVPIALCFGAFGYDTVRLRRRLLLDEAALEVRDHGTALQVALDALLREHRLADLAQVTEDLAHAGRVEGVLIFDGDDQLVAASRSVAHLRGPLAELARRATDTRRAQAATRVFDGVPTYAYAFPIGHAATEAPRGAAVVLRQLAYVDANVRGFERQIAMISLLVMLVVAVGTWRGMRGAVIVPVTTLARGVDRVAAGDLDVAIAVTRADEVGRLATAFNAMTRSLRGARDELEVRREANGALERRLQHAQRLALIGQLSASLAHEVGSPLNVILGRARYALQSGGQGERDRRHFEEIVAGAERISGVIEQLLSHARRTRGRSEPVDLGALAHATVRFVGAECDRAGIATRVEAEPGVVVTGPRDELEQVILNLAMNAIQAQPRGGLLVIRVRRLDAHAEVEVRDAGAGVPAALRDRVFEPFFTTKPASHGTGLGLAICDEIVRRQGGAIMVDDALDGGAVFRVSLPLDGGAS